MSGGRIAGVIISVLVLLVGLGLLAGGGAVTWVDTFLRDGEGFYNTRTLDIDRDAYAVTSYPARIEFGPAWIFDWPNMVEVKVSASNNGDEEVFIGIGKDDELLEYLNGVEYDEITELNMDYPFNPTRIEYRNFPGDSAPALPADQDFWSASDYGEGSQELRWGLEEGRYSLALMNKDASRGIDVTGKLGVKVPSLKWIGIGLLIGGFILVILSLLLIYGAIVGSRS